MKIFNRAGISDELLIKNQSLSPFVFSPIYGFEQWPGSYYYLEHINSIGEGYILNIDIDCFVYNWGAVERLLAYMRANKLTHCGMRDGGVCPHRVNDERVMNPFFNIFDSTFVRFVLNGRDLFDGDSQEPFNRFFIELGERGNPLFLDVDTLPDEMTVHLMNHESEYFALHSWYSREYGNDPVQTDRIDSVYDRAMYYRSLQK